MRFPISVSGKAVSADRTDIVARGHRMVIDEPPERGGSDAGPTPLETLMAALAGCTTVILNKIAAERGWQVADLAVEVTGQLDPRGVRQGVKVPVVFPTIALTLTGRMVGADIDLDAVSGELARRCPVSALLRDAGSVIEERWTIAIATDR